MRVAGALLAGLAAAVVLVLAVEFLSSVLYPLPAGMNPRDRAALHDYIGTLPMGAFALVLAGWGAGTFAGAFLAARIGRSAAYGFVIGALLLAAGVANMMMVPHPAWFWAAGIIVFVVTTVIAVRSAVPSRATAPDSSSTT